MAGDDLSKAQQQTMVGEGLTEGVLMPPPSQEVHRGQYIRWAVGTPEGPRSQVWSVKGHKNTDDVYLGLRDRMDLVKLSFHRGTWRLAYTSEAASQVVPEWFSDEFGRLLARAGLPRGVLHEARHTTLSLLAKSGVPVAILSAWAGHHDARFTLANYVHVNDEDLAAGAVALGELYRKAL